jgi:hypothetical protein
VTPAQKNEREDLIGFESFVFDHAPRYQWKVLPLRFPFQLDWKAPLQVLLDPGVGFEHFALPLVWQCWWH